MNTSIFKIILYVWAGAFIILMIGILTINVYDLPQKEKDYFYLQGYGDALDDYSHIDRGPGLVNKVCERLKDHNAIPKENVCGG